jgi:hypothetical protein
MLISSNIKYYLFNIAKKRFLAEPTLKIIERTSGILCDFPTYNYVIDSAIAFTITFLTSNDNSHFTLQHNNSSYLTVTNLAIAGHQGFTDLLESGVVKRTQSMFFFSQSPETFSASHRNDSGLLRSYTPLMLCDNTRAAFDTLPIEDPLDPSFLEAVQIVPAETRDSTPITQAFQWMLVPTEVFGGINCSQMPSSELAHFATPAVANFPSGEQILYGIVDEMPVFRNGEECAMFHKLMGNELIIGWQCVGANNTNRCVSVTRNALVLGKHLHESVGDCLLNCDVFNSQDYEGVDSKEVNTPEAVVGARRKVAGARINVLRVLYFGGLFFILFYILLYIFIKI